MASQIDESFPADNVRVDKALMRAQFATIKTEMEEQQQLTTLAWKIALEDWETL